MARGCIYYSCPSTISGAESLEICGSPNGAVVYETLMSTYSVYVVNFYHIFIFYFYIIFARLFLI